MGKCIGLKLTANKNRQASKNFEAEPTKQDTAFTRQLFEIIQLIPVVHAVRTNAVEALINSEKYTFLTLEEIGDLVIAPSINLEVKRAFLFSCFSGLNEDEIREMVWYQARDTLFVYRNINQKYELWESPISQTMRAFLPDYFDGLVYDYCKVFNVGTKSTTQLALDELQNISTSNKALTWQNARLSFAANLLMAGTSLEVVQLLLGHFIPRKQKTTKDNYWQQKTKALSRLSNAFLPYSNFVSYHIKKSKSKWQANISSY